jgi:hypothetical protein
METIGRSVLDTRLRGYDDRLWCGALDLTPLTYPLPRLIAQKMPLARPPGLR